ncbi:RNA-binding ATPase activator esf2 [Naganishia friedmannii]|uniref:RNA-binding ATPase activator esf2 n=1 Tax=Naganishia friedmannii TaxID=89922 RepID=A0ACC2VJ23_9TREE|nr:RNA-binding ATPase activator esf2 [Naganishia friedmannii]
MEASTSTSTSSPPPRVFPKKRIRIPGIEDLDLPSASSDAQPTKKKSKKLAPSPGIVYISRLPPGMTHQKVKHILTGYGDIGKIYAQQKDAPLSTANNQSRKRKHVSANYTEAWVEFKDKKIAKVVADMLNATTIGGKKGDRWRDDIWTMKYLSGFKWEMLGEQVAYERQAHSARLRQELSKSRAEQSEYLRNVELARVLEKRKAKKQIQAGDSANDATPKPTSQTSDKAQRVYKQKFLVDKSAAEGRRKQSQTGETRGGGGVDAMSAVMSNLF